MKTLSRLIRNAAPWLIAEIGVNHDGETDRALELVRMAARCGANAVKFQYFKADRLAHPEAPLAAYQRGNGTGPSQHTMLKRLEFPLDGLSTCLREARRNGLAFGCTPFDPASLDELLGLGMDFLKIGSGDADNLPLLRAAARSDLPVILSCGMSGMDDLQAVLPVFSENEERLALLHCVSAYPAPEDECNLRALEALQRTGCITGFSDHTKGHTAACLALALRARIIEKHITLDRTAAGPDHACSLDEMGFRDFVRELSRSASILGDGIKRVMPSELDVRQVARKSLVAREDLTAGHRLAASDLTALRPAGGFSPMLIDALCGRKLASAVKAGQRLVPEDLLEDGA